MPKQCSTRSAPARGKSGKRAAGAGGGQAGNENLSRERDITRYARVARKLVSKAWPEIMEALVARARSGRYQEIKLLIELCDLGNVDSSQLDEERQQQLCDVLLERLKLTLEQPESSGISNPLNE